MMYWGMMLKYFRKSGIFIPFRIYCKSSVIVRKSADVKLHSRVTIGQANNNYPVISLLPANLYFGYHSKVYIEKSVTIGPGVNLIVKDNALLSIGEGTYFTSDMHIEAVNSIKIGKNCAIAWGSTIIDDDHHQTIYPNQLKSNSQSMVDIGDRVWIGCNCTILKGTVIGENSIVAAGSVVKGSFPSNSLIGGNPARVLKQGVSWA